MPKSKTFSFNVLSASEQGAVDYLSRRIKEHSLPKGKYVVTASDYLYYRVDVKRSRFCSVIISGNRITGIL